MKGFGLDYDTLATIKPDLVMISACLNGQTGPHKDYPGFGGQGAALSGYNWLTGWPDLEPVGPVRARSPTRSRRGMSPPHSPPDCTTARRTGRGVYLDLSQVEAGTWTLAPWLLAYAGRRRGRGPATATARRAPFPTARSRASPRATIGDRWVAIACWTDDEWARLAAIIGLDDPSSRRLDARLARVDEVEAAVAAWTRDRTRADIARAAAGRGHRGRPGRRTSATSTTTRSSRHATTSSRSTHPFMGPGLYERNGFRLSDAPSGYDRAGPTLGQDNDWVLGELLGLSTEEQERLHADGAVEIASA